MQLVYRDPKKHTIPDYQIVSSEQTPKKKGKTTVCNYDLLTNEYQQGMLAGLFMASNLALNKKLKILHLGTGAGVMPMFLRH